MQLRYVYTRPRRRATGRRLRLEPLETRLALHAGGDGEDHASELLHLDEIFDDGVVPADFSDPAPDGGLPAAAHALADLPVLNSLAGAAVSLYLNFLGHFDATWGGYSNVTTPVYDVDGDESTFSDGELSSIYEIWQAVSEDYAPFQVNVTTVVPSSFANGTAIMIAIGGGGAWTGGTYGGVAYIDSFTNSLPNVAYVFSDNLGNGYSKYVADAASHEAGHTFGLQHQSQYNSSGSLVASYYAGPGNGTAPIMGNSYSATRSMWWYGTSTSAGTYQDDMNVIAGSANGFGYRADDHGDTVATATALTPQGNQIGGSGILGTTSDLDYFSFFTDAGQISFSAIVTAYNNLDLRIELRDAAGTLLASAAPTNSFSATITTTVAGGSHRLIVASNGGYGNVGQYTVSGTIVPDSDAMFAPTGLIATAGSGLIDLAWADNCAAETEYFVDRSDDGVNWATIATLAADATAYADTGVVAGGTYRYRVWADNADSASGYSATVEVVMTPDAPANLVASTVSATKINLTWDDVAGETSFRVERSTGAGSTWTQIATVAGGVTTYLSTGLAANSTYLYRVSATNSGGNSAPSATASATTQPMPAVPAAPTNLVGAAPTSKQVNLAWQDNATNEDGYRVQRSTNGGKSWYLIAQVGIDATSYSDATVSKSKSYVYRVQAFNEGGASAYSNKVTVKTPKYSVIAPTTLVATQNGAQLDLAWQDNSADETGFSVQRKTSTGSWKQIALLGADANSYSDLSAVVGKTYSYRVRALDAVGTSAYTDTAKLKVAPVLAPPASSAVADNVPHASVQVFSVCAAFLASSARVTHSVFADTGWVDSLSTGA